MLHAKKNNSKNIDSLCDKQLKYFFFFQNCGKSTTKKLFEIEVF